jgi:hypothetical protein
MKKVEAALTTKWIKWAKYNLKKQFIAEVKWCPNGRFNFKSGSFPKELRLLTQAKHGVLMHKQSDIGMIGTLCDVWGLYKSEAWVVIFYDKKRFYIIDIDKIMALIKANKKSITENEASLLADYSDTLR